MTNGQGRPNKAVLAERDARIFRLKLQGLSERQISATLDLPKTTVHDRVDAVISELVNPLAEQSRAIERARLDGLRIEANAILQRAKDDPELRLKAIDRLLRISERAARLDGLDAREPVEIVLQQRIELEGDVVAKTILGTVAAVLDALPDAVDGGFRERLRSYALETAQHTLMATAGDDPGPAPTAPRPYKMITAGSPERPSPGPGDPGPHDGPAEPSGDAADAVLAELAAVQAEFPSLDWS